MLNEFNVFSCLNKAERRLNWIIEEVAKQRAELTNAETRTELHELLSIRAHLTKVQENQPTPG